MKKKSFSLRPDGWTNDDEWKFNSLWEFYPPRCGKKTGKSYAREVFKRISPGENMFAEMLAAVREQKVHRDWKTENGQYVPDLSTWLNQGRWEDEIIT